MKLSDMSREQVFAIPMERNDIDAPTVGEYLKALLMHLWEDGEGFSGKRPFGNSGWNWDLYTAVVRAGLTTGHGEETEDDGYQVHDEGNAKQVVCDIIEMIFDVR